MAQPELTVGMACHDDYHGVVFTCQSLALHHALHNWEIVVVDNNPNSPHGKETAKFAASVASRKDGLIRYVPMPEGGGTSQPRNRVFAEARGEIVICMDAHVLLAPGSLDRLLAWYAANPDSLDLVQGPLIYDVLGESVQLEHGPSYYKVFGQSLSTHFDETWRGEMEGTWQTDPRGLDPLGEPFDIPAQGLGFFSCRKAAWLGFNQHFRQFGGEECYIHRKFRAAGRRTLCHPGVQWWHRFGRPEGPRYALSRYGKVRNYVLGHQELGLDLAPVHEHFVASGLFAQSDWDYLLQDPVAHVEPGKEKSSCGGCGAKAKRAQPSEVAGLDEIFTWAETTPRDLNAHLHTLRELAHNCDHVTEFSKRRETTVALLAGRPKTVVSYNTESDPLFDRLHAAVEKEFSENRRHVKSFSHHAGADSLKIDPIEPTDLLLIHSVHHADRLWAELERHGRQVRRYLALVSTGAFAEKSEDGKGPGLLPAMRRWVKEHPEWSVIRHTDEQWGLTVLSRDARDKPKLPGKIEMAANFAKALTSHVADGAKHVSTEQMEARLEVCSLCPLRADDRCSKCGCFIAEKAKWRSSECPLAKWAPVDAAFVEQSETQPEAA